MGGWTGLNFFQNLEQDDRGQAAITSVKQPVSPGLGLWTDTASKCPLTIQFFTCSHIEDHSESAKAQSVKSEISFSCCSLWPQLVSPCSLLLTLCWCKNQWRGHQVSLVGCPSPSCLQFNNAPLKAVFKPRRAIVLSIRPPFTNILKA